MRIAILTSVVVLALAYLFVASGRRTGAPELFDAIDRGDLDAIRRAVRRGADVNRGFGETTPLIRATFTGRKDVVRLLIELGADADAETPFGRTPVMVASMRGDRAMVDLLVADGAGAGIDAVAHAAPRVEFLRRN